MNVWPYILATVAVVVVTGMAAFLMWLLTDTHKREREHVLAVVDRYQSRSFPEFALGKMMNGEVQVDQEADEELSPKELEAIKAHDADTEEFLETAAAGASR